MASQDPLRQDDTSSWNEHREASAFRGKEATESYGSVDDTTTDVLQRTTTSSASDSRPADLPSVQDISTTAPLGLARPPANVKVLTGRILDQTPEIARWSAESECHCLVINRQGTANQISPAVAVGPAPFSPFDATPGLCHGLPKKAKMQRSPAA